MKLDKAMEVADWLMLYQPKWNTTVEAGYSNQSYVSVEVSEPDVRFVIRSSKPDTVVLSGEYGNLSRYILDGDTLPRQEFPASLTTQEIAGFAILFADLVAHTTTLLKSRMEAVKENYARRTETANMLARPGVKITGNADIWWKHKKNKWQISGEIHQNGGVTLNIICDAETAKAIFDALRKE